MPKLDPFTFVKLNIYFDSCVKIKKAKSHHILVTSVKENMIYIQYRGRIYYTNSKFFLLSTCADQSVSISQKHLTKL